MSAESRAGAALAAHRRRIEELDAALAAVLSARFTVCAEVAELKREAGIAMMQPARVDEVKRAYEARGRERGIDPGFMRALATLVIDEACRLELAIMEARPAAGPPGREEEAR